MLNGLQTVVYGLLMAKVIPLARRGRFLGLRDFAGGTTAAAVAWLAGRLLRDMAFPASYGVTYLVAFVFTSLGLVCFALVGFYATAYRGSAPWAGLFTKVFAPIANPPSVGTNSGQDYSPPVWTERERLNVLLLGVDSRGDSTTQNTDTMIVLSLDPVNKTAAMLSIPRDVYIDRPGVFTDKINAAYAYGGYDLTRKVVEDLLGIRLNAYALVDFDAFTKIVDAVGGVVIDVKRPVRDESYPTPDYGVERLDITAGPQLMDGQTALRFARSRHDTNDYSRAQRQQLVLSALRTRISEGDFLRGLPALVDRVGSAVQTNFDPANILPLAQFGTGIDGDAIRSEVLYPCGGSYPHCELQSSGGDGGFYLIPDRAKIRDLAAALFYDPQVKSEGASVEVRSAGARNGVAQSVADRLTERAFVVSNLTLCVSDHHGTRPHSARRGPPAAGSRPGRPGRLPPGRRACAPGSACPAACGPGRPPAPARRTAAARGRRWRR